MWQFQFEFIANQKEMRIKNAEKKLVLKVKNEGVENLHTKLTTAGIIFNTFMIIWTHTFQYMRFIVDNIPIIEFIRLGIDW